MVWFADRLRYGAGIDLIAGVAPALPWPHARARHQLLPQRPQRGPARPGAPGGARACPGGVPDHHQPQARDRLHERGPGLHRGLPGGLRGGRGMRRAVPARHRAVPRRAHRRAGAPRGSARAARARLVPDPGRPVRDPRSRRRWAMFGYWPSFIGVQAAFVRAPGAAGGRRPDRQSAAPHRRARLPRGLPPHRLRGLVPARGRAHALPGRRKARSCTRSRARRSTRGS